MIIDKIQNAHFYYGLGDRIEQALKYIQTTNLENLEKGKYEIDGDNIFAIIQEYETKYQDDAKWEAHRKYIDIQYIIKGAEQLGYLNIEDFTPADSYNDEKDIIFGDGNGDFLLAEEKYFLIFTPQDVHMPSICLDKPEHVKKAVIKIKV